MQDSFQLPSNDNDNWLMHPGAEIEPACRLTDSALHFAGTLHTSIVIIMMMMMIRMMMINQLANQSVVY